MFCANCGTNITGTDSFCAGCGTPVQADNAPVPEQSYIPPPPPPIQEHPVESVSPSPVSDIPPQAYDKSVPPPQQQDTTTVVSKSYDTQTTGVQPKKRLDSTVIATISIIAVGIIITAGAVFFFSPWGGPSETPGKNSPPPVIDRQDNAPAPPSAPSPQSPEPSETKAPPPATDTQQTHNPEVSAVYIMYEGSSMSNFTIRADESVFLYASVEPDDMMVEALWNSSDTEVFQLSATPGDNGRIQVIGVAPGNAILTVTAGNVAQTCYINVIESINNTPMHQMLGDAIRSSNDGIVISIEWTSGRYRGNSTVFERYYNSNDWVMFGVSDTREVFPTFVYSGDALTIGFPTTTRIYYLFEDGTGYFRNTDGTNNEDLKWEYWVY